MLFVILRKGHQFNVNGISSPPWSTPWNGEKDLPWIPFLQHIYIHYLFGSLLRIPLNLAVKNNRDLTKKYNKNNISHISYNVSSIKWKDGFIMLIHVSKAKQDRRNGLAPPCSKIFWGLVFEHFDRTTHIFFNCSQHTMFTICISFSTPTPKT